MSEPEIKKQSKNNDLKGKANSVTANQSRQQKLKQIDSIYRSQIKLIYQESKQKLGKEQESEVKIPPVSKKIVSPSNTLSPGAIDKNNENRKSTSSINMSEFTDRSKLLISNSDSRPEDDRIRASVFLKGESTRTIQILRKENEAKEIKIRSLSDKVENLLERLKSHLDPSEYEKQLESLKQFSDRKMQRLQNLFKIKNQEIFFKIKLQIIGLLQEFQVPKEEINDINQVNNQSTLFTFMVRKLKLKLKDFKSKEQQSTYEIQKDKVLNQKYEQRIHYLMQTNELLKLSQGKLKQKIDDLKIQMNQFLNKLKQREKQLQERESQVFRLKKQNEQLNSTNVKILQTTKYVNSEKVDEKRIYEAKQKEMKTLLANYFVEKKKLQTQLQEKESYIEEILIRQKFLEQQNERINRQYVRWKERYEWLQKQKETKVKQVQQERSQLINQFEQYKSYNNQGILLSCKTQIEQVHRKVEQYQVAYQTALLQLQEQRKSSMRLQEQYNTRYEQLERQWLQKVKRIEKIKQEQLLQAMKDSEVRQDDMRHQFLKKQERLIQEMQARINTMLAEKQKRQTEMVMQLQAENEDLRRQIDNLNRILEVKESLISVINSKKAAYQE